MVTVRGDYILNSDRGIFFKAVLLESRLHTYHWMVLAVLQGGGALQKPSYVVDRIRWPLAAPKVRPQTEGGA